MIIRSIASRHGRFATASPITRSCLRLLSTETTNPGLTPEQFEALTAAAALNQTSNASASTAGSDATASRKLDTKLPLVAQATKGRPSRPAHEAYKAFRRLQKATSGIGSVVERRYVPDELVTNPPGPDDITLELLMASQTHMGHNTALWNPSNARYIYGTRAGIHIISLETTASHLRRAARVVEEVAYRGGLILFVGTRRGQMEMVTKAAKLSKGCHLFTKWTPGGITNRDIILADREVRVVDGQDREIPGFDIHKRDGRPLLPHLVICMNPLENYTLLYECGLAGIPTIGVIDTDVDPSWVTYTIPANDDSLRSIGLICGILGRAGEIGQKRRLQAAATGVVHWETPTDIKNYIATAVGEWTIEQKRWRREGSDAVSGKSGEEALLDMVEEGRNLKEEGYLHAE